MAHACTNGSLVADTSKCEWAISHYKQLNFGGGRDWLGATAVALMGSTQAGDKNNVALKIRVLPHDELPLVFPWKFRNLCSLCGANLPVVWYMTIGKVMRCKHLLEKLPEV